MRRRTAALVLVMLALVAAVVARAQQPVTGQATPATTGEQLPAPQPTFKSSVNLVRVDVTVTGRADEPLADLAATDFEVREDGVPQAVESLQFVSLDGQPSADHETSLEIRSPEHAEAEAARDDVRLFAIFLDDYHITRAPAVTLRLRDVLTDFIKKEMKPTDLWVLMDPLTPMSALKFTRSREELLERIKVFEGRRGIYTPARSVLEESQLLSSNVPRVRSEVTLSALHALVTQLGSLRDRRSSVIFVSEGPPIYFPGGGPDGIVRDIVQAANSYSVTIHALDPRGLTHISAFAASLSWLAADTGGEAIVNSNSFARGLATIARHASADHLLGYAPTRTQMADGKFHRIEVKVRRSGARAVARKGYWAPSEKDLSAPPPVPAPPEQTAALEALVAPRDGRPIKTWVGFERGDPGRTVVRFSWEAQVQGGTAVKPMIVRLSAVDAGGTELATRQVPEQAGASDRPARGPFTTMFDVPDGSFQLKLSVEEPSGEIVDKWTEPINADRVWDKPLTLGTPAFFRARTPLEYRALTEAVSGDVAANPSSSAAKVPVADRDFRKSERLFVRFPIYGTATPQATFEASLLNRSGQELVKLEVTSPPDGVGRQVTIPLASLAQASYMLRITARAGEDTASETVAFKVVP